MSDKIFDTTVYENHKHLAYVDELGNGTTSVGNNHTHRIVNRRIQPNKNHIHKIVER